MRILLVLTLVLAVCVSQAKHLSKSDKWKLRKQVAHTLKDTSLDLVNIGPCTNHALDGQSCSFDYHAKEETCTAGAFRLYYANCDRNCDLPCDLHPPRNLKCEDSSYLAGCTRSVRGYCKQDCGIGTYVTSYLCEDSPNWLSCPDYCCCDTCGPQSPAGLQAPAGTQAPAGPSPESCSYYKRHFPEFGTCPNRKGADNEQVCPGVKCPSDMHYLDTRCVCITKEVFSKRAWSDANDYCKLNYPGGHLLLMGSASEATFIQRNYDAVRLWIGVTSLEDHSDFRYIPDDQLVTANMWARNEPNNHGEDEGCVEYWNNWRDRFGWNDETCTIEIPFICETEPYIMQ